MALPGLLRITSVAKFLGIDRKTVQSHLFTSGVTPIRRPRESAKARTGPLYVTVEDAVRLVDFLLPRAIHAAANRRVLVNIRKEAKLMAESGPLVRYNDGGN